MAVTTSFNYYQELKAHIESANATGDSFVVQGGGTKAFYGRDCPGKILDIRPCTGVIAYEPTELVITARAGTSLSEIETILANEHQMFAFESPHFGKAATLGGMVACGLSGPRRPYCGAVRDFVLGVKCLTGKGDVVNFGGQVIKNVAGYDVSRLMTGALGTLGVLLEISIKVLPQPDYEISLVKSTDFDSAIKQMNRWAGQPLPISAACYEQDNLIIRLSGKRSAVKAAMQQLAMDEHPQGLEYCQKLREHQLEFFKTNNVLWRISVPSATGHLDLSGEWLIDWGGAQRWLKTSEPIAHIRTVVEAAGGHATLFKGGDPQAEIFHPLAPAVKALHKKLKATFDPNHILNKGRMYSDF